MKAYKSGYLKVSENHELYYEAKGNSNWIPVLFLHGWPGSCFKEKHERSFDLEKQNVIFFDQRWAGKSKVIWNDVLIENTTDFLVEDIIKILDFFNIEKINIFWRSWWSTLALVFAIRYPEKVISMVIWGIYLGWVDFEDEFLYWNWCEFYFPDKWEKFLKFIPEEFRDNKKDLADYVYREMQNWNYKPVLWLMDFEWDLMTLDWRNKEQEVKQEYTNSDINSAKIEFSYIYNKCYISKDYILDNCNKLDDIEISIVQWRYDSVCPTIDAYNLDKKLKNSKLNIVLWGHSWSEKEILECSKKEVSRLF